MKVKEITAKKDAELKNKLLELKKNLTKLRFEVATKESKEISEIKKSKRTIARINTILREREIGREETADEKKA